MSDPYEKGFVVSPSEAGSCSGCGKTFEPGDCVWVYHEENGPYSQVEKLCDDCYTVKGEEG